MWHRILKTTHQKQRSKSVERFWLQINLITCFKLFIRIRSQFLHGTLHQVYFLLATKKICAANFFFPRSYTVTRLKIGPLTYSKFFLKIPAFATCASNEKFPSYLNSLKYTEIFFIFCVFRVSIIYVYHHSIK